MALLITNTDNVNDNDDATLALLEPHSVTTASVGGTTYWCVAAFDDDGVSVFSVAADGTLTNVVSDTSLMVLRDYWHFVASGDFNGDGRSDILWRDDAGVTVLREMDGPTIIGNSSLGTAPTSQHVADVGDYTGDLQADILWRDDAGVVRLWEMSGPAVVNDTVINTISTRWEIVA
jgi:hypothetical protein